RGWWVERGGRGGGGVGGGGGGESVRDGGRCHPGGLGGRHAGASGGGHRPHAAGADSLPGHRSGVVLAVLAGHAGRGLWGGGADGGRAHRACRGPGRGRQNGGAVLGGRAVSAQGGAAPEPGKPYRGGRSLLSAGPRYCPPPGGKVAGVAGGYESESALAAAGETPESL